MKYQKSASWHSYRPEFFKLSLAVTLAIIFMAFNYTYDPKPIVPFEDDSVFEDELITPPTTTHEKKIPTPPPPPKPKLLVTSLVEPVDEPIVQFDNTLKIPEESNVLVDEYANNFEVEEAPMVKPIIPEPVEKGPLTLAERMPVYGSCNEHEDENQRRACTSLSLLRHLYENVKYPALAREANLQGTVVASFVVNKKGEIEQVEILRDIGLGCGNEVSKAIKKLNKFYPGKQNGRPVSVIYRIPVKFRLD